MTFPWTMIFQCYAHKNNSVCLYIEDLSAHIYFYSSDIPGAIKYCNAPPVLPLKNTVHSVEAMTCWVILEKRLISLLFWEERLWKTCDFMERIMLGKETAWNRPEMSEMSRGWGKRWDVGGVRCKLRGVRWEVGVRSGGERRGAWRKVRMEFPLADTKEIGAI